MPAQNAREEVIARLQLGCPRMYLLFDIQPLKIENQESRTGDDTEEEVWVYSKLGRMFEQNRLQFGLVSPRDTLTIR